MITKKVSGSQFFHCLRDIHNSMGIVGKKERKQQECVLFLNSGDVKNLTFSCIIFLV
jgi:hypothetical protein